jgi:hypothetical protein
LPGEFARRIGPFQPSHPNRHFLDGLDLVAALSVGSNLRAQFVDPTIVGNHGLESHGPNRWWSSSYSMKALTISAVRKSPLSWVFI